MFPFPTVTSMFEEFSAGYYLGRLYVQPSDTERAVMHREQHVQVNEELYASDDGIERLDAPLLMKLDETHFPVHGEESVPQDTLAVPAKLLEQTRVRNPPALKEVLLAKADRAQQLLRLTGAWEPATESRT